MPWNPRGGRDGEIVFIFSAHLQISRNRKQILHQIAPLKRFIHYTPVHWPGESTKRKIHRWWMYSSASWEVKEEEDLRTDGDDGLMAIKRLIKGGKVQRWKAFRIPKKERHLVIPPQSGSRSATSLMLPSSSLCASAKCPHVPCPASHDP